MEPWLIGMQLALLGCFSSAVGLILLKHSTSVESHLPLYKRKFWLIGIVFLIVNASVIDVFAFSLAPITLVAPFTVRPPPRARPGRSPAGSAPALDCAACPRRA